MDKSFDIAMDMSDRKCETAVDKLTSNVTKLWSSHKQSCKSHVTQHGQAM